jgi:outer membrane protein assembly factor BamB
MKRGNENNRRAVRWAAFLFVGLTLSGGCTGDISLEVDSSPQTTDADTGPAAEGTPPVPELWETTKNAMTTVFGLAAQGNTLYVSAGTGLYIFGLPGSGEPQLTCAAQSGGEEAPVKAPATIDGSGNVYFTRVNQLCVSSVDSVCQPRWNLNGMNYADCKAASDTQPRLVAGDSQVAVATYADGSGQAHVWGLDAGSGQEAWHQTIDSGDVRRSLTAAPDGTLFVGASSGGTGRLMRLDAGGASAPQQILEAAEFKAAGMVGSDGTLYIGDWHGAFYALERDGTRKWWDSTKGRFVSEPVAHGGEIVVAAPPRGVMTWQMGSAGKLELSYAVASTGTVGVAVDGAGTIYTATNKGCDGGNSGGCVYAFSGGEKLWEYQTISGVEATPIVHQNTVIVGDDSGTLYGFRASQ